MKILYVDHEFHKKTESSNFFVEILQGIDHVELETYYLDPDGETLDPVDEYSSMDFSMYDLVVVWQLEILSLPPLAQGVATLIVPMFDGCSQQPDEYWKMISYASIVNFSYNLHANRANLFRYSKLVQFFPNPDEYTQVSDWSDLRVFLWVRRPNEVNPEHVFRLSRHGFGRLHFHLSPDNPHEKIEIPEWMSAYNVTTSSWFSDKSELKALMDEFNVFICPRLTEGIGMFLVESLARGGCVIANSAPTHNEYIAAGINGHLFDFGSYSPLDLSRAEEIGKFARLGVERGYDRWQAQKLEIADFVKLIAIQSVKVPYSSQDAAAAARYYFSNMEKCREFARHMNHIELEDECSENSPASICIPSEMLAGKGDNELTNPMGRDVAVESLRMGINKIPGWNRVKKFVPLNIKNNVVNFLASKQ